MKVSEKHLFICKTKVTEIKKILQIACISIWFSNGMKCVSVLITQWANIYLDVGNELFVKPRIVKNSTTQNNTCQSNRFVTGLWCLHLVFHEQVDAKWKNKEAISNTVDFSSKKGNTPCNNKRQSCIKLCDSRLHFY